MKEINYGWIATTQTRLPTAKKDHLSGATMDITVNIFVQREVIKCHQVEVKGGTVEMMINKVSSKLISP